MAQILSILISNPRLQDLAILHSAIPRDGGDRSAFRVPLHHLKKLTLNGALLHVFRLLHRLDHPETMDEMTLLIYDCTVEEIMGTFGPYVRDYLRRDRRVQDGLGIFFNPPGNFISIRASDGGGPTWGVPFAMFTAVDNEKVPPQAMDKLHIDFLVFTPREQVVHFGGVLSMEALREMVPTMPGIKELHVTDVALSNGFLQPDPDGPRAGTKLLPSLRHLYLERVVRNHYDLNILLQYLAHQTSGGHVVSLSLSGERAYTCKHLVKVVKGFVDEFTFELHLASDCLCDYI